MQLADGTRVGDVCQLQRKKREELRERLEAWLHPINAESIAAGRSQPPSPPAEIAEVLVTRAVNQILKTTLTPAQVNDLPCDVVEQVMLLAQAWDTRD